MTREEAIEIVKEFPTCLQDQIDNNGYGDARFDIEQAKRDIIALNMAIKALSAIEDIKAEINEFIKNPQFGDLDMGASCGAVKCLEIIDRHISGKENE